VPTTFQSDVAPLRRVVLKHATDAFGSPSRVAEQWRGLGFLAEPDYDRAAAESDALARLLEGLGVTVEWMPASDVGLDSIYVRDAAVVTDRGIVPCPMGKPARAEEPAEIARVLATLLPDLATLDVPSSAGSGHVSLEGGDVTWLDERTLAVGRGYRTSEGAITGLVALLPEVEVVRVPLPHWKGPDDVFHLMSMLSPLAPDLLLVYSPLLPVPFRERLVADGFELVEVPDEEFDSQGCNVLAVAPRVAVALDGNPETRRRMEAAGVEVHVYEGREISAKGCGGPTCLTRPLERG
jgi:N-dimethylarginine dimethylaminohydrolase